jgi:hypothetical protein
MININSTTFFLPQILVFTETKKLTNRLARDQEQIAHQFNRAMHQFYMRLQLNPKETIK